ncbi:unnamed protein product, partial [Prorocentrum cordatum]
MTSGKILRFDREKGYGFMRVNGGGEDVFFMADTLPPELQPIIRGGGLVNAEVEVEVTVNAEGKPRAQRVFPRGPPMAPPPMAPSRPPPGPPPGPPGPPPGPPPGQRGNLSTGTIVTYDEAKGFGFIKADGIDEDIFFLKSELPPELREAPRGRLVDQRVEFEVRKMPDGKMRAQRIGLHFVPQWPAPPGVYPPGPPGPPGDGRRCIGRIRKLDRAKGYGFIEVPGEQDVFFMPSALPKDMAESRDNLSGIEVSFEVRISEEGKPRANEIRPAPPPGPPGPYGRPPMAPYGPPPMGPPVGPPMMGMGMPPFMGPPMGPMGMMMGAPDRVYFGHIVSYDPAKGFGFVAAEGVPEDVFFPKGELPPELRDQEKGKVQDKIVSFEIRT